MKWGKAELGTPAHVTYAFVQQPIVQEKARNCRAMDSLARLARLSSLGLEDVRRQASLVLTNRYANAFNPEPSSAGHKDDLVVGARGCKSFDRPPR